MNRSTNKKNILIFLLFILCSHNYFINAQVLEVERINTTNGLSNNKVLHIFQDSYGLLWIATEYGLNQYDGYNFKIFRNDPGDPQSINSNVIWWIVEDAEKNLWISTGEGVSKYLRTENKFQNYDFFGDYFSSITAHIDLKGDIWAAVETKNILKYNKSTDSWDEQKLILIDSSKTYGSPAHVMKIIEDMHGKLWIASIRYGLMYYDENENAFRQAEIKYENGITDFVKYENMITDIFSDSTGIMWITSRNGVHKYNPISKELKTIQRYTLERLNPDNAYTCIRQDQKGNIWITNSFNGLLKFDGISNNYKRITLSGQNYSDDGISNIVLTESWWDNSGVLWIGTFTEGLIKYDSNKKLFKHHIHNKNNQNSLSKSAIFSLIDSKVYPDLIYVGTRGGGLNLLDLKSNKFSTVPIKFDKDIYGGSVRSILEEKDGTLWLGTWGDGLLKLDSQRNVIQRFHTDSSNINSISNDRVRVLRKDSSGNLWIGTNIGLNYLDPHNSTFTRLSRDYVNYSQGLIDLLKTKIALNNDITKITKVGDSQNLSAEFEVENTGNYLVITAGEGNEDDFPTMWDYGWLEDSHNKILWGMQEFDSTFHLGGALKNRMQIDLLQLNPGKYSLNYKSDDSHSFGKWNEQPPAVPDFWGIRIFKIDDQNEFNIIQKYLVDKNKNLLIKGDNIKDIHLSKNNVIWIGTHRNGLHKINKNENNIKTYLFNTKYGINGTNLIINQIYENNEENLWLATNHGLIKFNPFNETFINFTDQDGLPINSVHSILPGESNEMWLGTLNGLSKMIMDSTGKPTFVNYNMEDGLGGMDFTQLVALKSNNGKYYFGGDHGLNEFGSETSVSTPPNLFLSDLKVANRSIFRMHQDSPIKASFMDMEKLSLNHTQNDLSFEFAALHFSDPKKNKYAHKLEGYEDDWIYDNNKIATYTNLDPGEYTFKFKGSNSEGLWNETGKSISVTISPPWWQTLWAYIGYGLLFIGVLFGVDRIQRRKLLHKAKERMKIQDAEHRAETAELQAKAAEAQSRVIQVENERKTKELEEARHLQLSMLPKELPQIDNLELAVFMKTATEVGGDYYDFSKKDDGSVNIAIGDATGHGMKAGTLVSMMKSIFTANSPGMNIEEFFKTANNGFKSMNLRPMMMGFMMLNINEFNCKIINSGMPPVFLFRKKNRSVEEIEKHGIPIGAMNHNKFSVNDSVLQKGDVILLMSDGMPELQNDMEEMYGYKRIRDNFKMVAEKDPESIISFLRDEGSKWVNDSDPDDDVTFVVIKVK